MVGVDDEAFADGAQERREDRQVGALPGHADEQVPETHDDGDEHQRRIADAGDPAAGHEGIQIGVVGVFREIMVELQRADAERQIERHVRAENVPSEPAEATCIVTLIEAGALFEQFADRVER